MVTGTAPPAVARGLAGPDLDGTVRCEWSTEERGAATGEDDIDASAVSP
jgi:hypothetical protein